MADGHRRFVLLLSAKFLPKLAVITANFLLKLAVRIFYAFLDFAKAYSMATPRLRL